MSESTPLIVFAAVIAPLAAAASYVGVKGIRRWAAARLILDHPNARSSHLLPTPRGGGLAIVAITSFGAVVTQVVTQAWPWPMFALFWASAVMVAIVSWFDDVKSLPHGLRLAVHLAAASVMVVVSPAWHEVWVPLAGVVHPPALLQSIACILWITGLTNAYNFMDGVDGMAGAQAVVAGAGWLLLGSFVADPMAMACGSLILGSALGFLIHNWQPARIFMGDVGATFIGFVLASLTVVEMPRIPRIAVSSVLLVWPFIADTAFTFFRRLRAGETVLQSHRSHVYQRLNSTGLSHARVSTIYAILAGFGLLSSITVARSLDTPVISICLIVALGISTWAAVAFREAGMNRTGRQS
jgi:UDP-N-acetylmuramyl pentapeptide phosphotransferase/UDP-N-acetylglucosamine-1-phosphate transferase